MKKINRKSVVLTAIFTLTIILLSLDLMAQVGIGTITPDASAQLEISSTNKGLLTPRLTKAQRDGISSPQTGLLIFQLDQLPGFYVYDGSSWVRMVQESYGDIKSGIQTADHAGWVLLDGRPLSALSTTQQTVASALGISTNLPNASNAYLVQNGSSLGNVSGSNTVTISQANLPNVNFTGTTDSNGAHAHAVDPAPINSTSDGTHNHEVDPASVNTSTDGNHNHTGTTYGVWSPTGSNSGGSFPGGSDYYFKNATLTINNSGSHSHSVDIPATTSTNAGSHNHSVDIPSTSTTSAGNHIHNVTVGSGGADTPLNIAPKSLSVNMFIYLGN